MSITTDQETIKQILMEIGWVDGWGEDIDFASANYRNPKRIYVEGTRKSDGARITAEFSFLGFEVELPWIPEDDDEDEDDDE